MTEPILSAYAVEPNERVLAIVEKIIDQQGRLIEVYARLIEQLAEAPTVIGTDGR